MFRRIILYLYKVLFYLVGKLLTRNEKLIIFESFLGKQYSDNPRAIYEYMKEEYPSYELYWSVDKNAVTIFKNLNIKYVKRFTIKWILLMNKSKYWITNSRLPLWIPKPKDILYIQTWHGTPLKKLVLDMQKVHMPGTDTAAYKRNFLIEATKWDFLISPNNYSTQIFKSAFQFKKEIIESGYPRNDFLIQNNNQATIEEFKDKVNIPKEKKVILYAPTWRDNQFYSLGKYKFNIEMDLNLLKRKLSDEYVLILRLHYLIAEHLDLSKYDNFVYDLSSYIDIRELYLISDILITDYSSTFFDYANLKRPIIFYVYDIEEYRDKIRGFYFDIKNDAPGPLVKTTEEIIEVINKLKINDFLDDKYEGFYNQFCYLEDGRSTARVVKEIFGE